MAVIKGNTSSFPRAFSEDVYQGSGESKLSVAAQAAVTFLRAHPDEDFNYTISGGVFTFAQRTDDLIYVVEAHVFAEHDLPLTEGPIALPKVSGVRYVCTYCDQTLTEVSLGQYRCQRCV